MYDEWLGNYDESDFDWEPDDVIDPAPVIKKLHSRELARKGEMKCDRCPPHKMENVSRGPREDKYKNHRTK